MAERARGLPDTLKIVSFIAVVGFLSGMSIGLFVLTPR